MKLKKKWKINKYRSIQSTIDLGCASALNCESGQTCDNHECVSASYNSLKSIQFTTLSCEVGRILCIFLSFMFINLFCKVFCNIKWLRILYTLLNSLIFIIQEMWILQQWALVGHVPERKKWCRWSNRMYNRVPGSF